ncbi:hypothetical protein [Desertivirga brevis]|uniref:hypothetical protein n=1 Tax=Desertivirga brevis TaxID=2810310 RepID=UPI001A964942|nr:hypothetical protein [Pedobacter sp. SYSU D00873]
MEFSAYSINKKAYDALYARRYGLLDPAARRLMNNWYHTNYNPKFHSRYSIWIWIWIKSG